MRRVFIWYILVLAGACQRPSEEASLQFDSRRYIGPYDPKDLGSCVTIDGTDDPSGALNNLRANLTNAAPHNSVAKAIDNLIGCSESKIALAIVGHGGQGVLFAGAGSRIEPGKFFSTTNVPDWTSHISRVPAGTGPLTLLSCNTGAGNRGATLLTTMAANSKRTVRARTGLVYCGATEIHFEDGSEWHEVPSGVTASPKPRPKPIHSPFGRPASLTLGGRTFGIGQITSLVLEPVLSASMDTQGGTTADLKDRSLSIDDLAMVDFQHPFTPPGEPLAPLTARIHISLRDDPLPIRRTVLIYGDVVARDAASMGRFFDVEPQFTERLAAARE